MIETTELSAEYEPLTTYAGRVWQSSRQGVPLSGMDAAMASAMSFRAELRSRWNWLAAGYADQETLKALREILDTVSGDDAEIRERFTPEALPRMTPTVRFA